MGLLVLLLFIFFLAVSGFLPKNDKDDYDWRDEYFNAPQNKNNQSPAGNEYYSHGNYLPPMMPLFDPKGWYEAETRRQQQNFQNGFKMALLVLLLLILAFLYGRYGKHF